MMSDLGLYVHIPFCLSKCKYCDFLSFDNRAHLISRYIKELRAEIADVSEEYRDRGVKSVYIGGGTPCVLSRGTVAGLVKLIRDSYDLSADAELSIEINPAGVDDEKLHEYKECGINRLSIGLQSADDRELNVLGRIHTYEDFLKTYALAHDAGFDNINIDLIFAIPGQTVSSYYDTLCKVIGLKPKHVSAYGLQIEEGTYFGEHPDEYEWTDEESDRKMYHMSKEVLDAAGINRYEISNYAVPGYECRHNIRYWTGGGYLGFGIGAASCADDVRFKNTDSIEEYLRGVRVTENIPLSVSDRMEEYMFLGLRMIKGISASGFYERFGRDIDDVFGRQLSAFVHDGLIVRDLDSISLTPLGLDVSNHVFAGFLLNDH